MQQLRSVDGLRAIAVLAVVVDHVGDRSQNQAVRAWTLNGAHGVDLFFVVSGLCLSLAYFQRRAQGDMTPFDRRAFAYGRAKRLLPAYYAALLLFWALSPLVGWPVASWGHYAPPTLTQYLGYFGLLYEDGGIGPHGPHANGVYWTLALEMRWYCLFPFLLALYVRSRVAFAAVALLARWDYTYGITMIDAGTLPCFMLGIVAADLYVRGALNGRTLRLWLPPATALAFVAAAIVQTRFPVDHGDPQWYVIPFGLTLAGLGPLRAALSWSPLVVVGRASYSVYLVHFPVSTYLATAGVPLPACALAGLLAGIGFYYAAEAPLVAAFKRVPLPRSRTLHKALA